MLFGFDDKRIYTANLSLFKQSRAYVDFLTQYNASVDSALKIPLLYAKNTKSLKMIFGNFCII